ncbi:related to RSM10-mitochondrial ribosomal protein, small subunit [Sporisorium reilianum f. sp. reilianum]|uniref:Small ribosomal subunit protein uS10m n=1 Tax=Sporisorium reilianum f. sp. reilianum TaxID=72559 RepID=A0A2N8UM13_9BASI|nr:related to RSM10-mitochondrial ribosomal protein, small subunit [Sporisorium reilianum f. sp. reilianum]
MASRSTGVARQLLNSAAASSRVSARTAVPVARTFASASSRSNASTSWSVTLDQPRNESQPLPSTQTTTPTASDNTTAITKEEEQFVLPNCLLPTESLPQTHGVHVATLHLRSYTDGLPNLDLFADFARRAAFAIGIPAGGVAHLPTRTSLWTVPRSPFVHKKSQENFWRKTHSRAIKLYDANDQVVDRWLHFLRIHALPGVGQKAELFRYHEVGVGGKLMDEAKALQRSSSSKAEEAAVVEESAAEKVKKIADGIVEREVAQEAAAEQK